VIQALRALVHALRAHGGRDDPRAEHRRNIAAAVRAAQHRAGRRRRKSWSPTSTRRKRGMDTLDLIGGNE
jgi:hypothetical protein